MQYLKISLHFFTAKTSAPRFQFQTWFFRRNALLTRTGITLVYSISAGKKLKKTCSTLVPQVFTMYLAKPSIVFSDSRMFCQAYQILYICLAKLIMIFQWVLTSQSTFFSRFTEKSISTFLSQELAVMFSAYSTCISFSFSDLCAERSGNAKTMEHQN